MKRYVLSAALLAAIAAAGTGFAPNAAWASEKCSAPRAEWQPQDALQQKLEAEGWKIRRIKVDDGCYEVYGTDAQGQRMETYFDPKTLTVVATKVED